MDERVFLPIGVTENNEFITEDVYDDTPNFLIFGYSGSGKSAFIMSALHRMSQIWGKNKVEFAIIDTHGVDYKVLSSLTNTLFCNTDPALESVLWVHKEMQRRMDLMRSAHYSGLTDYNANAKRMGSKTLPRMIFVLDDIGELIFHNMNAAEVLDDILSYGKGVGVHVIAAASSLPPVMKKKLVPLFSARIVLRCTKGDSKLLLGNDKGIYLDKCGDAVYKTIFREARCKTYYEKYEDIAEEIKKAQKQRKERIRIINTLAAGRETFWDNIYRKPWAEAEPTLRFHAADTAAAEARLARFAPLIMRLFPETEASGGLIESELKDIPDTASAMGLPEGFRLLIKLDSELPIAGSVKARGGIYEVLKHTEDLALSAGLLRPESGHEDYASLADHRDFFADYSVQVGSTGNLGLSIGIMSAAIGYKAVVHMSSDAKKWKKDLLRAKGAQVVEYEGDYAAAVAEGRRLSDADPKSYFVDDESSESLYLGYSVAGRRLKAQLDAMGIPVDSDHKLAVYIPCGVGGAPGGICFGLKQCFGDDVIVCFIEPVQAPCMLLGLATGRMNGICVQDIGLSGKTEADGLAVSRCSGLVSREMKNVLDACCTVDDERLCGYMRMLRESSGIVIEPSSCAAFRPLELLAEGFKRGEEAGASSKEETPGSLLRASTHIIWATGGGLMPAEIVKEYLERGAR